MNGNLHVFALNEPLSVSHTALSRSRGEVPELPPLADWLGVEALDTDRVELFAVKELGEMRLSDYLAQAFDVEAPALAEVAARLNALDGSVLIVPDRALSDAAEPGPQAVLVASLPVLRADHGAELPKSRAPRGKQEEPAPSSAPAPSVAQNRRTLLIVAVALALAAALVLGLT